MATAPRRRRHNAPLASAPADIVLPKPGMTIDLPPAAPADADHIPDAQKPKLPPGTKRTVTLEQLKARAKKQNILAKQQVIVTLRISVPAYKACVELAEEYNVSVAEIQRQCLDDGIRKYRDFNSPYAANPFRPVKPFQAFPDMVIPMGNDRPKTGEISNTTVAANRRAVLAEDLTGPIPTYDNEITQATTDNFAELLSTKLGNFLPQSPLLPKDDVLAYDPLAPTPDEDGEPQ